MLSWGNIEGGQLHQPSDGPELDDGLCEGVCQALQRFEYKQNRHYRGKRHRSRNPCGLYPAASGGVHQEEAAEDHGQ